MPTTRKEIILAKQLHLRKQLWPDISDDLLWDRKVKTGFATIPRAFPILLTIIDRLTKPKPAASTYFALWCRCWDEKFMSLANRMVEIATESGFNGQRAVQSVVSRMDSIERLGLIKFAPGPAGKRGYVLLLNPYVALSDHKKSIDPMLWNAMLQRMLEIGATDISAP